MVRVRAAYGTAVGGQGAEGVVQAGAEGQDAGHGGEFGARGQSDPPLVLRVHGSVQRQIRTVVALAQVPAPASRGFDLPQPGPAAPAFGEGAHRKVPVGGPTAASRQGQCCPAVVLMDVDMDVGHGVPQRLGVPTALRQPVVAGAVDIQGVRGRKRAQQQTADRLDDKGLLPVVAEADAGAEHGQSDGRGQLDERGQPGPGLVEFDGQVRPAVAFPGGVASVPQARTEGRTGETGARPAASVAKGSELHKVEGGVRAALGHRVAGTCQPDQPQNPVGVGGELRLQRPVAPSDLPVSVVGGRARRVRRNGQRLPLPLTADDGGLSLPREFTITVS